MTILITKNITTDIKVLIGATVGVELLKFIITSKTRLWNYVWGQLLISFLRNSSYFKLTKDENFISLGFKEFNILDGEIWKKNKSHS